MIGLRATLVRVVGVGAAGSALAAVAAGQGWVTASVSEPATRTATAQGSDVAPLALPLALVALAAWGSVLVLRGVSRRAVAVLGLLAAAGSAVATVAGLGSGDSAARHVLGATTGVSVSTSTWPFVALAGAVLAAVAFGVAAARAGSWPTMSRRYDAPTAGQDTRPAAPEGTGDERELWRALDEGRDPTL